MGIEKDIQQKNFESEYQKALVNLIYTHNHLIHKISATFKSFGITRQQYNVLRILRGQHPKPASVNLIKERMLDKMSDASRIVERLRIKGLVTRTRCANDKRAVEVCISEKGLNLLKSSDQSVRDFGKLMGKLDIEDVKYLNKLLDSIRE